MNKEGDEVQLVGTLVTMIELAQRTRREQEDRGARRETAPADREAEAAAPVESGATDLLAAALPAQGVTKPHRRLLAGAVAFVLPFIALAMAIVVVATAVTQ